MKSNKNKLFLKNSFSSMILVFIIILILVYKLTKQLSDFSGTIFPILFSFLLIISIILIVKNIRIFSKNIKITKKEIIILLLIIILSISIRTYMPYRHLFVPDDYWLMEQGKNFILQGNAEVCEYLVNEEQNCYFMKSTGYPVILSILFSTLGLNNLTALVFNSILSIINIILFFILVRLISNKKSIALISTFIFSISIKYLYTSIHVDNIIFGLTLTFLSYISYYVYFKESKEKNNEIHFLAVSLLIMASITRIEYFLIISPIFIIYLKKRNCLNKKSIIPIALLALLTIILSLQISIISDIGDNSKFSTKNIIDNFKNYFQDFINIKNLVLTALLIIGIKEILKENKNFFSLLLLFLLPFTIFYTIWTSPHIHELLIIILLPIFIFIAYGFVKLRTYAKYKNLLIYFIIGFLIILFVMEAQKLNQNISSSNYSYLDLIGIEEIEKVIPKDCYTITERPSFASATTNIKVIRSLEATKDLILIAKLIEENKCIILYENSFCYNDLGIGPGRDIFLRDSTGRCNQIKNNFKLEKFFEIKKEEQTYNLYYIRNKV